MPGGVVDLVDIIDMNDDGSILIESSLLVAGERAEAVYMWNPSDSFPRALLAETAAAPTEPAGRTYSRYRRGFTDTAGRAIVAASVRNPSMQFDFREGIFRIGRDGTTERLLREGAPSPFSAIGVTLDNVLQRPFFDSDRGMAPTIDELDANGSALPELQAVITPADVNAWMLNFNTGC